MRLKTLQEIVLPVVTALLEKRYQFSLKYRNKDSPSRKFPKSLTFSNLAKKYRVSPRTLNRWLTGETKSTKKSVRKITVDASKFIKSSRAKLSRAGKKVKEASKKIVTHVERLKFKHGRPTWRLHTLGMTHDQITDFTYSLIVNREYEFMYTIWNPENFSGDRKLPGQYTSSGWISARNNWTKKILHRWILREQLSRGEIHAIIFTKPK